MLMMLTYWAEAYIL